MSEIKALEPHQQRVVAEYYELREKLVKLNVFLMGDRIDSLSAQESFLLRQQSLAMGSYLSILKERIDLWK